MEIDEEEETTYKSSLYIYYLVGVTCLGSFFTGYQIGVYNQSQNALHIIMNIEDDDDKANFDGLITSLIPLGGVIGAYISHHILKTYSRKNGLILADVVSMIGCALQICLFSEYLFILGRFICGLSCGLNSSLVSLYITEVAPIQMRQRVSTLPVFSLNFGTFIAYCTGIVFTSNSYSIVAVMGIFGFPILPSLLRCILLRAAIKIIIFSFKNRFFMQIDSPYFYFENGELTQAKKELGLIYKEEYIDHIYHDYHQTFIEKQKNQETQLSLFNKQNRRRMFIVISQMYFLHFVGVSAVMLYSTKLFTRVTNMNRTLSIYLTVISGIFPILCSFVSGYLSQQYGRKHLLQMGMNGQIFITLCFAFLSYLDINDAHEQTPKWLSILLIINVIVARSYVSSTYAPNSLAYTSDICCDKGMSIAFMAFWFFQGVIGYLFPHALYYIGQPLTFIFFSLNSVLGSIFVRDYVKETQGLTRIEIMLLYNPEYEVQIDQKLREVNSLQQALVTINNLDVRNSLKQSIRMEQEMTSIATVC